MTKFLQISKTRFSLLLAVALVPTALADNYGENQGSIPQPPLTLKPSADLMRQHMATLAADDMQGREAGTPGYDKAAKYVADQFKKLGLQPAGDEGSFFQEITFKRSVRVPEQVSLQAFNQQGDELSLAQNEDFVVRGSLLSAESDVTADVVFAGYGLVAPELGRDDYAGLDVDGKLVALLAGTPSGFQSEERAYYGSQKGVEASKRGAIGVISLYTPVTEKIRAFKRIVDEGSMDSARMGWIKSDGTVFSKSPNLEVGALFSLEGAAKLFQDAPADWSSILEAAAKEGGKTPTFKLPLTLRIQQQSTLTETRSANVLGMIPGTDPKLKNEVLVLSAHLDGLGITNTGEEDSINNGALDNAAGVATLLEAARMLMALPAPRRSVVFLANTAEEKGLLGAEVFARRSTLPDHSIVANINLDMPVLTYDFQDVVVFGGDRSSLRGAIRSAAEEMDIAIGEDPFPEQGIFTRSDHFRFVEIGVPSVMLATGMLNGGEQAWAVHFSKHYHQPSDDMHNDIDFNAAAKFAELKTRVTLQVANADQRPLWNKGDFFARQFDGPMAKE